MSKLADKVQQELIQAIESDELVLPTLPEVALKVRETAEDPNASIQDLAKVIGNDATIAVAGQSGLFELNVMQPVAAISLIESIELLAKSADNFRIRLVDGLTATDRGPRLVEEGLMLATALTPALGYDKAAAIAHEAATTGETIRQVALRVSGLSEEELNKLLDPLSMVTNRPPRRRRR